MNIRTTGTGIALAAVLTLGACASGGAAQDSGAGGGEQLTISILSGAVDLQHLIAQEQGFYEDEGIAVEATVIAAPPSAVAAAASGQVDIAYVPVIPALQALREGNELTIVAGGSLAPPEGADEYDDGVLFAGVDSGVETYADLPGKTVAVPARGGVYEVVITGAVEKDGGDAASIQWVTMDFPAMLEALRAGGVDAAPLHVPLDLEALELGMTAVGTPASDAFGPLSASDVWVAGDRAVEERGEPIAAFQRAIERASAWANENPDESRQMIHAHSGLDVDPSDVRPLYWPETLDVATVETVDAAYVDLGFADETIEIPVQD